jgi:hypothetical protein
MDGDGNVQTELNVDIDINYQKATLLPPKRIERRIEKRLKQLLWMKLLSRRK